MNMKKSLRLSGSSPLDSIIRFHLFFLRETLPDQPPALVATPTLYECPPPLPLVDHGHHVRASLHFMTYPCRTHGTKGGGLWGWLANGRIGVRDYFSAILG